MSKSGQKISTLKSEIILNLKLILPCFFTSARSKSASFLRNKAGWAASNSVRQFLASCDFGYRPFPAVARHKSRQPLELCRQVFQLPEVPAGANDRPTLCVSLFASFALSVSLVNNSPFKGWNPAISRDWHIKRLNSALSFFVSGSRVNGPSFSRCLDKSCITLLVV